MNKQKDVKIIRLDDHYRKDIRYFMPKTERILKRLCRKAKIKEPEICVLERGEPSTAIYLSNDAQYLTLSYEFCKKLSKKELEFTIGHEIGHFKKHHHKKREMLPLFLTAAQVGITLGSAVLIYTVSTNAVGAIVTGAIAGGLFNSVKKNI